ncbi:hypothetical protein JOM56_015616 [Amanita muscaria]
MSHADKRPQQAGVKHCNTEAPIALVECTFTLVGSDCDVFSLPHLLHRQWCKLIFSRVLEECLIQVLRLTGAEALDHPCYDPAKEHDFGGNLRARWRLAILSACAFAWFNNSDATARAREEAEAAVVEELHGYG